MKYLSLPCYYLNHWCQCSLHCCSWLALMNSEILKIRIYREYSFFMLKESGKNKANFIKQHAFQLRYYLSFTSNGSLQELESFVSFKFFQATPLYQWILMWIQLTEAVVPRCLWNRCSLKFHFKNVNLQETHELKSHFN